MAARSAVGLDIGTSGVRAAELSFGKGEATLQRFGRPGCVCTGKSWASPSAPKRASLNSRLPGVTCYDIFACGDTHELLAEEPGTYFLTDFLVRAFDRVVVRPLGLDRHPELRDDYFRHYRRVVWLAQAPTAELRERAERAAATLQLPLEMRLVGDGGLELALEQILC